MNTSLGPLRRLPRRPGARAITRQTARPPLGDCPTQALETNTPNDNVPPIEHMLYLHRYLAAKAAQQSPALTSKLTTGDLLEAAKVLKGRNQIWNWNPASYSSLQVPLGAEAYIWGSRHGALEDTRPELHEKLEHASEQSVEQDPVERMKPSEPLPVSSTYPSPTALGLQPHIIALIDGDGYVFNKELLSEGRTGGVKAAHAIAEAVAAHLNHRLDYRLSVYLFLTRGGLFGKLVASDRDSLSYNKLREFMSGFQVPAFNYVVSVGRGKEYVDTKLKELLRVSLRSPETESVILGVLHDVGYTSSIESEVLFQHKVKLLSGFSDTTHWPSQFPHLPILAIPGLFMNPSFTPESDVGRAARLKSGRSIGQWVGRAESAGAESQAVASSGAAEEDKAVVEENAETPIEEEMGEESWVSELEAFLGADGARSGSRYVAQQQDRDARSAEGWSSVGPRPRGRPRDKIPVRDPTRGRPPAGDGPWRGKPDTAPYSGSGRVKERVQGDRKAKPGRGTTLKGQCKNRWIEDHPEGTGEEFEKYWRRRQYRNRTGHTLRNL